MPNYRWIDPWAGISNEYFADGDRVVAIIQWDANQHEVRRIHEAKTAGGELIGLFLTLAAAKEAVEEHFKRAD